MYRCLQLASYGKGFVAPNPLVGSVIVHQTRIIGEGFHRKFGESHAEVQAIRSIKEEELLSESTLYVNLEPCSHYGKTPPCADLIIQKKIPRVVIGTQDPFVSVAGNGIRKLKEAGVKVLCGVLEKECLCLNRRFVQSIKEERPYLILKWAQSSDGFIDRQRKVESLEKAVRFSTDFTRIMVHKLRAEESAITVGKHTRQLDQPSLNVRYWAGSDPAVVELNSREPLKEQLYLLYKKGIQSLIVEGGTKLLESFLQENLWDEARVEVSNCTLGNGIQAPVIDQTPTNILKCENSILFYNNTEFNS